MKGFLGSPGDEFIQEGGVSALGMLGLAAFVAEMLQEVFDEGLHGLTRFAFFHFSAIFSNSVIVCRRAFRGNLKAELLRAFRPEHP